MLRGPGKIQRAIALLCRQPRNATVTAAAIAREVYGVTFEQEPTRAQRVAILGAGAQARGHVARVPLTTRVRADFAQALKRASLERQLSGVQPNTLQDILEEALGPWLRANGYVKE